MFRAGNTKCISRIYKWLFPVLLDSLVSWLSGKYILCNTAV